MRVVVGLDLNLDGYDWLLGRAVQFTTRTGGTLDIVFVGTDPEKARTLDGLLDDVPEAIRGTARMMPGEPASVLIDLTTTYDAIVLGPREPQGVERLFQNAMAVRVLRQSRCPVYVPRTDRFDHEHPKMLVGVDLRSDRLDYVLSTASRWAAALQGTVHLVHAMPRSMPAVRRADLRPALEREWRELHSDIQEGVNALLAGLPEAVRGSADIQPGEAEDVLLDASETHDLLVVGNRERRGLERFILGGVARMVTTRASCDVLILPTQFA